GTRLAGVAEAHAEEAAERGILVSRLLDGLLPELGGDLRGRLVLPVAGQEAEVLLQHGEKREVRKRLAERRAPAPGESRLALHPAADLVRQPRLPEPRVGDESHHLREAAGETAEADFELR